MRRSRDRCRDGRSRQHHGNRRRRPAPGNRRRRTGSTAEPATTSSSASAGNDVLVGGGGQRPSRRAARCRPAPCGPGRDTRAATRRTRRAGLRVVEGITGVPAASPRLPTSSASSAASSAPPAPKALPGIYCGNTVGPAALRIQTNADATGIWRSSRTSSLVTARQPVQFRFEFAIGFQGELPISRDLSFSLDYTGPRRADRARSRTCRRGTSCAARSPPTGRHPDSSRSASLSFDYAGYHFACTQNPVDWSVTRQG